MGTYHLNGIRGDNMASSGSFSGSIRNGGYTLRVDWTSSQSTENNTSTITCNMYLVQKAQYSLSISSRSNTTTIDGSAIAYTSAAINNGGNATVHLGTVTRTVSHNGDGSKSLYLSSVFNINATLGGTKYNTIEASSDLITLPTIPRASSVSCATSANVGSSLAISISRASSAFTHTLRYTVSGASGQIASGIGASYAWTIPTSLANYSTGPDGTTCNIICDTYQSGSLIGTKSTSFTLTVPNTSAYQPKINSIDVTDTAGYKTTYGAFLRGLSRMRVVTSASGAYGSTITSYSVAANNQIIASPDGTTGLVTDTCPSTVTATVKDSRNLTATSTVSGLQILTYIPPAASGLSVKRVSSSSGTTEDEDGNYAKISFAYAFTPLNNRNSKSITLKYRVNESNNYTTIETITPSAYSGTYTKVISARVDNAYTIQITMTDDLSSPITYIDLPTAETVFDILADGTGIAFGKVASKPNTLETTWDVDVAGLSMDTIKSSIIPDSNGAHHIGAYEKRFSRIYAKYGDFDSWLMVNGQQVVNRRSTDKGEYIAFYDGTLVCWKSVTSIVNITRAYGYMYFGYAPSWEFPTPFVDPPVAFATLEDNNLVSVCVAGISSTALTTTYVYGANSTPNYSLKINYIAIGRWKNE